MTPASLTTNAALHHRHPPLAGVLFGLMLALPLWAPIALAFYLLR